MPVKARRPDLRGSHVGDTLLTPKQRLFVIEYLRDFCGTKAAIRAGYSKRTAASLATQTLRKPYVAKVVNDAIEARRKRVEVSADRVLSELAKIAFTDLTDIISIARGRVTVRDTNELTPEQRGAIVEVNESLHGMRIKLHDKKGALELLGRHLGLFPNRVEVTGKGGGPVSLTDAMTDEELQRIARGTKDGE
jgi:phage terminase small subunit